MRALVLLTMLTAGCTEYDQFRDTREEFIEEFFDISGAKTDILFYADTSYSMQRELITLGNNIGRFVQRLEDNQHDWQILAVTGPEGCGQGNGVFTSATPNMRDAFTTAVTTAPEQDEVDEWGLFNVFQAVMKTTAGGCNAGFLREDATLHVVFLSDEDDNSPGYQLGGDYWRDYVDPVSYIKGDPNLVKFSAITGPIPSGCDGADPGFGYADAASATGGEIIPICGEWADRIDVLADASIAQAFFPLQHAPLNLESIEVQVNDVVRTSGWEYDEARQGIQFTADVPGAWDTVEVAYRAIVEVTETDTATP